MFKLLLLLCGTIFLTLLIGGKDGGAVRYGLVPGKMASLVYTSPDKPATGEVVVVAADPAPVAPAAKPVARQNTGVIEAAFVEPEAPPQTGLTLALPLVRQTDPVVVAAAPAPEPTLEPVIQYVVGTSVNVRAGPSADTEALTRLGRGEAVLVLPSDTPGWSMIRVEGDGVEGYIATRFLGEVEQDGLFGQAD